MKTLPSTLSLPSRQDLDPIDSVSPSYNTGQRGDHTASNDAMSFDNIAPGSVTSATGGALTFSLSAPDELADDTSAGDVPLPTPGQSVPIFAHGTGQAIILTDRLSHDTTVVTAVDCPFIYDPALLSNGSTSVLTSSAAAATAADIDVIQYTIVNADRIEEVPNEKTPARA